VRVRVRVRTRMWVAGEGGVRLGALGELELQLELVEIAHLPPEVGELACSGSGLGLGLGSGSGGGSGLGSGLGRETEPIWRRIVCMEEVKG